VQVRVTGDGQDLVPELIPTGPDVRALAILPRNRPVPQTPIYHIRVDDIVGQAAEHDLTGALLDLIAAMLALGEELLGAGQVPKRCQLDEARVRPAGARPEPARGRGPLPALNAQSSDAVTPAPELADVAVMTNDWLAGQYLRAAALIDADQAAVADMLAAIALPVGPAVRLRCACVGRRDRACTCGPTRRGTGRSARPWRTCRRPPIRSASRPGRRRPRWARCRRAGWAAADG
jgi:hypothetical protein